ncbi:MAG: type III PLP-dependent enzyme [Gammaproteobacteria bacterium]|nr:type III PLP-dependent enzyme [Gammaproteobacteria bacterium]
MSVSVESIDAGTQYRELVREHGSPLLVVDCAALRARYALLQRALPDVAFYYAVKSFPDPIVVRELLALGSGFDLATVGEISMAQSLGIAPRRTIHTHPIKTNADIQAALRFGCTTFVVDNAVELQKFVRYRHRVGLMLRVGFRNESAQVDLARKFGCAPEHAVGLLRQATDLGIHVKGLSFHVGSQCATPSAHVDAIHASAALFEEFASRGFAPMNVLDIGGGFPADYDGSTTPLGAFCAPIVEALRALPEHINVTAEPGRCLSAPVATSISSVIGKSLRGDQMWYYLDDGVYGSFSGQIFDHAEYPLTVFGPKVTHNDAVLAGPTCDSIDVVAEGVSLPDLGLGDIVIGRQMGAYTAASATDFNSIRRAKHVYLNEACADGGADVVDAGLSRA